MTQDVVGQLVGVKNAEPGCRVAVVILVCKFVVLGTGDQIKLLTSLTTKVHRPLPI